MLIRVICTDTKTTNSLLFYFYWILYLIPLRAAQPHGPQRQEAGSGTVTVLAPPVNASTRIATPGDSGTQRRVTLIAGANEDRALVPYQSEPGESRYSPLPANLSQGLIFAVIDPQPLVPWLGPQPIGTRLIFIL